MDSKGAGWGLPRGLLALLAVVLVVAAARGDWKLPNPFRRAASDEAPSDPFESRRGWSTTPPPAHLWGVQPRHPAAASGGVTPAVYEHPGEHPSGYREVAQRDVPVVKPPGEAAGGPSAGRVGAGAVAGGPRELASYAPQVIARIGDEAILDVDIMGPVLQKLSQEYRPGMSDTEVEARKNELAKAALDQIIEQKLVVIEARRSIPAERFQAIEKQLSEQFEKTQLKDLMAKTKARTRAELDEMMRQAGTSIERQKKQNFDRNVVQFWVRQQVNYEPEVTHEDMISYYQQHRAEFTTPGRVRWEELVVRFDQFPTREAAEAAIADMGNAVLTEGRPLAEVAKAKSQGVTASSGGVRDWATRGSLASQVLNDALFVLPVGQMSRILADQRGLMIVRVLERQDDAVKSFHDAQGEIREKIRKQKVEQQIQEYLAKLKQRIPVWTIYDGPATSGVGHAVSVRQQ